MSNNIVDSIYRLRQSFLIIGLTGRTGSGCSTIAKLLSGEFADLYAPDPCDYIAPHPNEKRKYSMVYNYLQKQWKCFEVISASDMLFFFVLLEGFDNFIKAISATVKDSPVEKAVELGKELQCKFEEASDKAKEINHFLECRESYKLKDAADKEELKTKIIEYKHFLLEEIHALRAVIDEKVIKETQDTLFQKYQNWGNSIRRYGSISNTSKTTGDPSTLSRKINQVVKMLRDYNDYGCNNLPTYVVIDALRNPYEVLYFRERYSSFYLMSVTTDEKVRIENLHNQQYTKAAIDSMDAMENPEKEKGIEPAFYEQDIAKCVGLSDIFISHDGTPEKRNKDLKVQLIRFTSLMLHPGLISPTPQERMMQLAFTAKLNSGCISRQVGAAISDANFSVRSIGWNTAPQGQVPCTLCNYNNLVSRLDDNAFSDYERNDTKFRETIEKVDAEYKNNGKENAIIQKGLPHTFCFKDLYILHTNKENQVHTRALHAEENAFLQLAKYGSLGIEGGKLFVTASPCELCSKKSYQLGIKEIYYIDTYPGIAMQHIIGNGDKRPQMIHFNGAIGRAYINLYNPLLSMKDEIANLTGIEVKKIGKESGKKDTAQKESNKQ